MPLRRDANAPPLLLSWDLRNKADGAVGALLELLTSLSKNRARSARELLCLV